MELEKYLADLRVRQARVRPHGTPSDVVYPLGEISLPEHVAHWARHHPDRAAVVFEQRRVTYRELDELSRRVAGWLESVGVGAGDRVAVHLPNCPQFVVAMLAVLRLGAVHVPVSPMFQGVELVHELGDAGAEVIVTCDSLLPLLDSVRPQTGVREVLVTSLDEMSGTAAPGGRVLIAELVVEPDTVSGPGPFVDLHMMTISGEGKQRSRAELAALFASSGFRLERVIATPVLVDVVEGVAI